MNINLNQAANLKPSGAIKLQVLRGSGSSNIFKIDYGYVQRHAGDKRGLSKEVSDWRKSNFHRLSKPFSKIQLAQSMGIPTFYGALYLNRLRPLVPDRILPELLQEWVATAYKLGFTFPEFVKNKGFQLETMNFGLASLKLVTDAGVGYIVDAFQNSVEMENMKFHGIGTGGTAESAAHTALVTELTTQYNPDNTRATGSTTETSANIYRTVGTNTVDAGVAITEHAILSQAAVGGGVMFDRSLFSANNLVSGDSLQSTYDGTFSSGG